MSDKKNDDRKTTPKESIKDHIIKAISPQKKGFWTKKNFPEVLYWVKQVLSIFLGLLWGNINMSGYHGVLAGVGSHLSLTFWYVNTYCQVDLEEYPPEEVLKEGAQQSIALFLLSWILVHTIKYTKE